MKLTFTFFALLVVPLAALHAAEFYVATNGLDTNPGTHDRPFRTIQKAADVMQAGDSCTVHAGTYREWVKPPRGGEADSRRITYRAAPGEQAAIKGSERITSWTRHDKGVWKIELPDSFFGEFNPYKKNLTGGWLSYGQEYHLGGVYLNDEPYSEKLSLAEVVAVEKSFFIEARPATTIIYANFGGADPNRELAEINARECVFFPVVRGLRYLTVDGFVLRHAAANWVYWKAFQRALLGTYWGRNWIIQNCRIADARCAGIVCGNDASGENEGFDVEAVGHHLIRDNLIERCGEAGIHGFKGWAGSIIENNLIQDINPHKQFGGEESGGIKIHSAIDVTIRGNVIRRVSARVVPGKRCEFVGIWVDWAAQGTRVSGNIVYDSEAWSLYLQNAHGSPLLVDNNIFTGRMVARAAGVVFAHNLFVNCPWQLARGGMVAYWQPHTAKRVNVMRVPLENHRYLNNFFIGQGADRILQSPGFQCDWNAYYQGAAPTQWGDAASIVCREFDCGVRFKDLANGVEVSFRTDRLPQCPLVTRDFVGVYLLTGQGLENPDGTPVTLDHDLLNNARSATHPAAGPFEPLRPGENTIRLLVGPKSP
jgi:hypothetical protein